MNYIRDFMNRMDWDDEIHNLFDNFIEDINEMSFSTDYENTPEFRLNQSIVNNAYLLRRTMELYPLEQREPARRSSRLRRATQVPHVPSRIVRGYETPLNTSQTRNISINIINDFYTTRNSQEYTDTQRYSQQNHNRRDALDIDIDIDLDDALDDALDDEYRWMNSPVWSPLDLNMSNNLTDNIFASLFTSFNDFMEDQLNDLNDLNHLEDVKVTLSQDEFNNLDITKDKSSIENKQCNICLDDLTEDELKENSLIQLKCNHIYHKDCIKEWLTKQSTKCPSCRFCCRTQTSTNSE
jgi:hypothetical protein